jgi:PAS domain S-box-containing protein
MEPTADAILTAIARFWERTGPTDDAHAVIDAAWTAITATQPFRAGRLVEADAWHAPGGAVAVTGLPREACRLIPAPDPGIEPVVAACLRSPADPGPTVAPAEFLEWLGLPGTHGLVLAIPDPVLPVRLPAGGPPPVWGWLVLAADRVPDPRLARTLLPMIRHAVAAALQRELGERILAESPHPINIHAGQERRRSNPAQERFIGFSDQDFAKDPGLWTRLSHPDDRERQQDLVDRLWRGEDDRFHLDKRYVLPDGRIVWGRNTYLLVRDHAGRVRYQISYLFDLTRIKAAEVAAREALAEAHRASAVRSRFLANASHEMRTPLHGITSALDLIDGADSDGERAVLLDTMRYSAAILLRLVNDVLELARLESDGFQLDARLQELAPTLAELLATLRPLLRDRPVRLELEIDPAIPARLRFDRERIQQIVANLVGNAAKFTRDGAITVAARCLRLEPGTATIALSVADTGIGMDEARRANLFEPFAEATEPVAGRQPRGSGLGLAIVRGLVQHMGGTIRVDSTPGAGTAVVVTLPLGMDP